MRKFSKESPTARQIWSWQKNSKMKAVVQSTRIWTISNIGKEGRASLPNTLAKPQKVCKKNKSENPDFSISASHEGGKISTSSLSSSELSSHTLSSPLPFRGLAIPVSKKLFLAYLQECHSKCFLPRITPRCLVF